VQGERCYCGDEDCPRCYPGRSRRPPEDEDAAYERWRQRQLDDEFEKSQQK